MIVMAKHGPGREKTRNTKEHTEKQAWSRSFRSQNDEKMGRKGVGRREEGGEEGVKKMGGGVNLGNHDLQFTP